MEFVLQYGDEALENLEHIELDDEQREAREADPGRAAREGRGARWKLTPRAINAMQRKALMEVFSRLRKGHREGHETPDPGSSGERAEGTRPYQFGDPVSELALDRRCATRSGATSAAGTPPNRRKRQSRAL